MFEIDEMVYKLRSIIDYDTAIKYYNDEIKIKLNHDFQYAELLRKYLDKTTALKYWQIGFDIVSDIDSESLWSDFVYLLNSKLASKNKNIPWLASMVSNLSKKIKVGHNLETLIMLFINVNLFRFYIKEVHPKLDQDDSYWAISSASKNMNLNNIDELVEIADYKLFERILNNDKVMPENKLRLLELFLRKTQFGVKNFSSLDFLFLLENHRRWFNNVNVMNSTTAAYRNLLPDESVAKLLTEIIMDGDFTDESKYLWLSSMYQYKLNDTMGVALYGLTQDVKYLTDEIKDIFVF